MTTKKKCKSKKLFYGKTKKKRGAGGIKEGGKRKEKRAREFLFFFLKLVVLLNNIQFRNVFGLVFFLVHSSVSVESLVVGDPVLMSFPGVHATSRCEPIFFFAITKTNRYK